MNVNDFQYGLDNAARIPVLVKEAIAAIEAKQTQEGQAKLEEAHMISAATQAVILLNLARNAALGGKVDKCAELAELAFFTLETAGLQDSELSKTATALLGLKQVMERKAPTKLVPSAARAARRSR